MKKKLWLTALIPLLIVVLSFAGTGCPTARSTNNSDDSELTIQDVQETVEALGDALADVQGEIEDINDRVSELEDASSPDLSSYATDAELMAAINNFIGNLTADQIATLKTALGINPITPVPGVPTGQVIAELVTPNPLWVSSGTTATQFQVRITNNTGVGQFVGFDLRFDIYPSSTAPQTMTAAILVCLTNGSWTAYWTPAIGIPNAIGAGGTQNSILFANTQKFWVAPSTSSTPPTDLFFNVTITGAASTWKCGSASGVVWSSSP